MKSFIKAAAAAVFFLSMASQAGETRKQEWKEDHPRRAEVNKRLNNQAQRIDEGVATGKMSAAEGRQLHEQDHAVRQEERAMAAEHNGHITKGEQERLNRQENKVSNDIYEAKH